MTLMRETQAQAREKWSAGVAKANERQHAGHSGADLTHESYHSARVGSSGHKSTKRALLRTPCAPTHPSRVSHNSCFVICLVDGREVRLSIVGYRYTVSIVCNAILVTVGSLHLAR